MTEESAHIVPLRAHFAFGRLLVVVWSTWSPSEAFSTVLDPSGTYTMDDGSVVRDSVAIMSNNDS